MDYPDRIKLLLSSLNLTAAEFADEIGIQRSSISHLLSGRNKPSLPFLEKCLDHYPEISPYFLIQGKGQVFLHENTPTSTEDNIVENSNKPTDNQQVKDVPTPSATEEEDHRENNLFTNVITDVNNSDTTKSHPKKLQQLIYVYTDGTFKVLNPA